MKITHLFPEVLNLYGDRGNLACLLYRLNARNIDCEVVAYSGGRLDLSKTDILLLGGGSAAAQKSTTEQLLKYSADIKEYIEDGGSLLAVCGGFQAIGESFVSGRQEIKGLGLLNIRSFETDKKTTGNIMISSKLCPSHPVVGFENHTSKTEIGTYQPFGKVISGGGNTGDGNAEGVIYKKVIGTYIHGPLLPKNPKIADRIISAALSRKTGDGTLIALPDKEEDKAREYMISILK